MIDVLLGLFSTYSLRKKQKFYFAQQAVGTHYFLITQQLGILVFCGYAIIVYREIIVKVLNFLRSFPTDFVKALICFEEKWKFRCCRSI